jgi:hypothetical protein
MAWLFFGFKRMGVFLFLKMGFEIKKMSLYH